MHARAIRAVGARPAAHLLVLFAVVAAALLVPTVSAEAITRPATLYHERPVGVGIVEPGFPIDHVGVVFDLPPGEDVHHQHGDDGDHAGTQELSVRFRVDGRWGPWQHMTEDGAQAEGQWTGALVAGGDADAYQLRGVPAFARNARAAALNTTDGPEEVVGQRPAGAAEAVTRCRSRSDWKADETIRTSSRSYADVQIMTVHHTATQNDDPDPDARVRAIYEYHVKTNKWDDIGYQALISEDGTVYEGRWSGSDSQSCATGGTGWDFGHHGTTADAHMVTGAHTGGYNTGNFGVALLGDFRTVTPKAAARDALVAYLAELADRHGIDPTVRVLYDNGTNSKEVHTISGHQDFTATECPGKVLYDDLPGVRTDVGTAMASNAAPVVTITDPSSDDTITVEESSAGAGKELTFAATATDESSTLAWTWTDASGNVLANTATVTRTLAVGKHVLTADATDPEGLSGTDTITVEVLAYATAPTYTDAVASGEQPVSGTVTGTHVDTTADDGAVETITEVESGGPPRDRHSHLEHIWTVPVPSGGSTVTLFVKGAASASGDGDDFVFDYSEDGGNSYTRVLTVPAGASGTYSAVLPSTTSGDVKVRVRDANRAKGNKSLDRLSVDHLYIRSDSTSTTSEPPAAGIALTTEGYKVKGVHHVKLTWSGATKVRVFRDGTNVGDVTGSEHVDVAGGSGKGSYTHRVCAVNADGSLGACSKDVTTTFA